MCVFFIPKENKRKVMMLYCVIDDYLTLFRDYENFNNNQ